MIHLVLVDGVPGAGKTTLIHLLKDKFEHDGYKVVIAKEPLDRWTVSEGSESPQNGLSLLQMFYQDPSRWGYLFQTRVFVDRVDQIREVFANLGLEKTIVLAERGLTSDTFFMKALYRQHKLEYVEYFSYMKLWEKWQELVPMKPSFGVYVKPSLDQIQKRIQIRGRKGEEGIPRDYLEILQEEHDLFYAENDHFPKLIFGPEIADKDFRVKENLDVMYSEIQKLIA